MVHCGDNGRARRVGRRFPALRLYFPVNNRKKAGDRPTTETRAFALSRRSKTRNRCRRGWFPPSESARITGRNRKKTGREHNLTLAAHLRRAIVMATNSPRGHDQAARVLLLMLRRRVKCASRVNPTCVCAVSKQKGHGPPHPSRRGRIAFDARERTFAPAPQDEAGLRPKSAARAIRAACSHLTMSNSPSPRASGAQMPARRSDGIIPLMQYVVNIVVIL
jgi:hypothetical protein